MTYVQLFFSFLLVGLFSVGGGYAAIPLIQAQVVEAHGWLSMAEFTNLVTIAEMTPGPIAVNSATFVGIRIAGVPWWPRWGAFSRRLFWCRCWRICTGATKAPPRWTAC